MVVHAGTPLSGKNRPDEGGFCLVYNYYVETIDEKLDEVFSKYTRMRFADWKGWVHCFTCTWYGHWKECDAGHFISRGSFSVRWDDDNARPQCTACNRAKDGQHDIFEEELLWTIGDERVEKLKKRGQQNRLMDDEAKKTRLIHMEAMVKALEKGHTVEGGSSQRSL